MTQLKQEPQSVEKIVEDELSQDLLTTTMNVEAKSEGMLGNFLTIAGNKTNEMLLNIIGGFGYKPKNNFSYDQKQKILSYLSSKVATTSVQKEEAQKLKFIKYDQHFLDSIPNEIDDLRNKIIKARTNIEAAQKTVEVIRKNRQFVQANYINEQAYEFDKVKYNSMAWGFLFGAFVNAAIYRNGNPIRKAALFLTFGHLFGVYSYLSNLDRFFDSVYPLFQKDAVKFSKQEKKQLKGWKPQGQMIMQD